MIYLNPDEFERIKGDLAELFVTTAARFAHERSLRFRERSLHQMSTPLRDVAGEVLMFGAGAWPTYARCDEDTLVDDGEPQAHLLIA